MKKIIFALLLLLAITASASDYYEILGLSRDVHSDDIKKSYRKLAMKFHPDRDPTASEEVRKSLEAKFKIVKEAYECLIDAELRERYDKLRKSSINDSRESFNFSDFFQGHQSSTPEENYNSIDPRNIERINGLERVSLDVFRDPITKVVYKWDPQYRRFMGADYTYYRADGHRFWFNSYMFSDPGATNHDFRDDAVKKITGHFFRPPRKAQTKSNNSNLYDFILNPLNLNNREAEVISAEKTLGNPLDRADFLERAHILIDSFSWPGLYTDRSYHKTVEANRAKLETLFELPYILDFPDLIGDVFKATMVHGFGGGILVSKYLASEKWQIHPNSLNLARVYLKNASHNNFVEQYFRAPYQGHMVVLLDEMLFRDPKNLYQGQRAYSDFLNRILAVSPNSMKFFRKNVVNLIRKRGDQVINDIDALSGIDRMGWESIKKEAVNPNDKICHLALRQLKGDP